MARAFAMLLVILCASSAAADTIDRNIRQLSGDHSYKVRLAAALALSKSTDPRAVLAVADTLSHDEDPTVRRVAALALERMIDVHTPEDAKQLGLAALDNAAANDADERVRGTAQTSLRALSGLRAHAHSNAPRGAGPAVFVNIDSTIDQSRKAPNDVPARITKVVKQNIEKTGYATTWTGGLPTQADLASASTRGFIVGATVKKIDVSRVGHQMEIACTVAIRVAPWDGKDGGEKWEANKAASASGSAKAMTGSSEREVSSGVRDCLEAVSEDVTARQVLPFLRSLATAGS
ncbi:MAG TPA: HEAT repeat domain-containing protein [Kofleriaceae bacterium]|jgi:hypothetical protein